jgi:hypothetical protein
LVNIKLALFVLSSVVLHKSSVALVTFFINLSAISVIASIDFEKAICPDMGENAIYPALKSTIITCKLMMRFLLMSFPHPLRPCYLKEMFDYPGNRVVYLTAMLEVHPRNPRKIVEQDAFRIHALFVARAQRADGRFHRFV